MQEDGRLRVMRVFEANPEISQRDLTQRMVMSDDKA